jgi:heme exporter protein A
VRGERLLFKGLDFSLSAGRALLVQGPNGAGKSSLLRLLAGLLPAAEGEICWAGQPVFADWAAHRRRLCYVAHLDAVKAVFTVEENLNFWARLEGNGAVKSDVKGALARLALGSLARTPACFLSLGQRRRLNLARLALGDHRLWLLDEPTAGLDRRGTAIVQSMIEDRLGSGGIVVAASHVDLGVPAEILTLGPNMAAPKAALRQGAAKGVSDADRIRGGA